MNEIQIVAIIASGFIASSTISSVVWLMKRATYQRMIDKLNEVEQKIKEMEEKLTSSEYICSIKDKEGK